MNWGYGLGRQCGQREQNTTPNPGNSIVTGALQITNNINYTFDATDGAEIRFRIVIKPLNKRKLNCGKIIEVVKFLATIIIDLIAFF